MPMTNVLEDRRFPPIFITASLALANSEGVDELREGSPVALLGDAHLFEHLRTITRLLSLMSPPWDFRPPYLADQERSVSGFLQRIASSSCGDGPLVDGLPPCSSRVGERTGASAAEQRYCAPTASPVRTTVKRLVGPLRDTTPVRFGDLAKPFAAPGPRTLDHERARPWA